MTIREKPVPRVWVKRAALLPALGILSACGSPGADPESVAIESSSATTDTVDYSAAERAAPSPTTASSQPSIAAEDPVAVAPSPPAANERCLKLVWAASGTQDNPFDRENDAVDGGSIACDLQTSASAVTTSLDTIRAAAQSDDRDDLAKVVVYPLRFHDRLGKVRSISSASELAKSHDIVFDSYTRAHLARLTMADMHIIPGEGAFFELGGVWIAANANGAQPRIITLNQQALTEADAARNRAAGKP